MRATDDDCLGNKTLMRLRAPDSLKKKRPKITGVRWAGWLRTLGGGHNSVKTINGVGRSLISRRRGLQLDCVPQPLLHGLQISLAQS